MLGRVDAYIWCFLSRHFPKCAFRPGDRPTKPVILSGVTASRSEAVTKSKDPMPACGSTGTARHSNPTLYEAQWERHVAFSLWPKALSRLLAVPLPLRTGKGSFDCGNPGCGSTCSAAMHGRTLLSVAFDFDLELINWKRCLIRGVKGPRRRHKVSPSRVVRVDALLLQNLQGDGLAKHAETNKGICKLSLRDEGGIFLFASLTCKLMPFRSNVPLVGEFGNPAGLPDWRSA
jgi:hypothetical protein